MAIGEPNPNALVELAAKTVVNDIRRDLKARCLKIIEPEIDAAVDEAVKGLQVQVRSYLEATHQRQYYDVIVRKVVPEK